MSLLDEDFPSDTRLASTTIQPVQVSLADAARSKSGRSIPPDVLIRIFQYLPVPTLATVATVSRRFKVLVYDDEIWDSKLRIMLDNDHGALAAMLGKSLILSKLCGINCCYIRWLEFKGGCITY